MAVSHAARPRESMSRALRTARGLFGAFAATLLAAASHALAGGRVTPVAIVATAVLALPVCVALAGRVASLWRLALAVVASQFVYHWSFSGLGVAAAGGSAAADTSAAPGPHAGHLAALAFAPRLVESAPSGVWMWGAHAVAALGTVLLLHRGERAAHAMLRLILRAVALPLGGILDLGTPGPRIAPARRSATLPERLAALSPISHRGPPSGPAFAL